MYQPMGARQHVCDKMENHGQAGNNQDQRCRSNFGQVGKNSIFDILINREQRTS